MASRKKALSLEQLAELQAWGIPLPETPVTQAKLYRFVKTGNQTYGKDVAARVAYAKQETEKWAGKRVRQKNGTMTGFVVHLAFRSAENMRYRRLSRAIVAELTGSTDPKSFGGYDLIVRWDGAPQGTSNSPYYVELLEPAQPSPATEAM